MRSIDFAALVFTSSPPPTPFGGAGRGWHLLGGLVMAAVLSACSHVPQWDASTPVEERLAALLPAEVLLLGEQHDAPDHQALQQETVRVLAERGQLAALALEMVESGRSSGHLLRSASETQVRTALGWDDKAWPWSAYGPVVMQAVRWQVPVVGANLPRARMKDAMADVSLDVQLNASAFAAQRLAVRDGHCGMLPAERVLPMTRVQVARDREMAHTVAQAVQGQKTVLLVTGRAHANKVLGVPQHLPTDLRVRSVALVAGPADVAQPEDAAAFDALWRTPAIPAKDYCASLRAAPARPLPLQTVG